MSTTFVHPFSSSGEPIPASNRYRAPGFEYRMYSNGNSGIFLEIEFGDDEQIYLSYIIGMDRTLIYPNDDPSQNEYISAEMEVIVLLTYGEYKELIRNGSK